MFQLGGDAVGMAHGELRVNLDVHLYVGVVAALECAQVVPGAHARHGVNHLRYGLDVARRQRCVKEFGQSRTPQAP